MLTVTNANPVAYWRFNESNGATVAADFFGHDNGVIGSGVTSGVAGPCSPAFPGFETNNTAMQLNGATNSCLTMPSLYLDTNTVSIAGWINPEGIQSNWTGVVFCRGGTTVAGLNFGPGSIVNELRYTWNNSGFDTITGLTVPTNQWSFFALVVTPVGATIYVGTNGVLNFFTDGVTEPAQAFDAPLLIGSDPAGTTRLFNGVLDEIAVFNHSLTPTQIQQLYTSALITPIQEWQLRYFNCTNCTQSATNTDWDGTGQNNLFKYVAGLDPTNPASVFHWQIAGTTNHPNLVFSPWASNRVYTVQFSTNLMSGVWSPLAGYAGPLTNGNQVTITDMNAAPPNKFYRLQITQP
jgi:Concanavalin A-like lectin/glucanases superfamily